MQFSITTYRGKQALRLDIDHTRFANDPGLYTSPANPFFKWYFLCNTQNACVPSWDSVPVNLSPFQAKSVLFNFRPYAEAPNVDILPISQVSLYEKLTSILMFGNSRTGQYQYVSPSNQGIGELILGGTGQTFVPIPTLVSGSIPFDLNQNDNLDVALITVNGKQDGTGTLLGVGSLIFVTDELPPFFQTIIGGRMYTS